ncbi:ROK family protein, partial [Turicibacter sanguinis]|nr:ROK family protein [Turicibacter sanguinis]
MKSIVCFDIGGTNVKYAVLSIDKQILEKSYFKTNIHNGQDVLKEMCRVIEDYKMRYDIIGVTISSPGFVNTKLGVIESGNIIDGFNGLNIKKYFEEKYNLFVTVENDANCATIAEHILGNGKGYDNVVCLTIGTGVGGGIIINNKIYNGNRFMAGEF